MTSQAQSDKQQLNRRLSPFRFYWFQRGLLLLALLCAQMLHAASESNPPKSLEAAGKWFRFLAEVGCGCLGLDTT